MGLDIRLPIGLLFAILGLLLIVFGVFSDPKLYEKSLQLNINLIWGIALLVFGGVMLLLGGRTTLKTKTGGTSNPR